MFYNIYNTLFLKDSVLTVLYCIQFVRVVYVEAEYSNLVEYCSSILLSRRRRCHYLSWSNLLITYLFFDYSESFGSL